MSVLALIQAAHRAGKGQCAILKWRPAIEALDRGETIYGRDETGLREGFPTLPTTALALKPFLAFGDVTAGVLWAAFKVALAWWMIAACARMAAGRVADYPTWAFVALIALVARVLLSDVAHGNINIPVAACVVASAASWARGRERAAGLWAGLGATLKVTPALLVLYFAWKRSPRAVLYTFMGVLWFGVVFPALFLGFERQFELMRAWFEQMVAPYASGAPLTVVQTEHINQSLTGLLGRLFTDSTAIVARPPHFEHDVSIHVLALSPRAFKALFYACAAAVLAFVARCSSVRSQAPVDGPRPSTYPSSTALHREPSTGAWLRTLGEFALVALAMLLLSERSWKQHYVVIVLPLAFLLHHLARPRGVSAQRVTLALTAASAALISLTGEGLLGERLSDYAEAYGAWTLAALGLFAAVAGVLWSNSVDRSPA